MVDALGPASPFSRANQSQTAQAVSTQTADEQTRTSANNGVNATPQNGVEVILTQAERVAEELTYENLRPNRSAQGNIESINEGESAADEALNSDALEGSRV